MLSLLFFSICLRKPFVNGDFTKKAERFVRLLKYKISVVYCFTNL
ncbi:hypothetical protein FCR2A7T_00240 [Flavobacterium cauense R2A-7]|nr:hypothetical protein FCR2A7T_00240 [Flavobacterium cauense R2A-7]